MKESLSKSFRIRQAVSGDRESLIALYHGFMRDMEALQPDDGGAEDALLHAWIDGAMEGTTARIWVAEADDHSIAGFVRAQQKTRPSDQGTISPEHYAKLSDLYIKPECRRNGLASRLLEQVEAWAIGASIPRLILNVYENNVSARKLYKALGFTDQSTISLNRVRMIKRLI